MPYLLDSNTFIAAKNQYYRFSFCPAYWDWVLAANADGNVFSIDKVKDELTQGNDDLATWAKDDAKDIFVSAPPNLDASMHLISQWAVSQRYNPSAISIFLASADYLLVAYAHALGYTVVTHEVPSPMSIARIKVPDACNAAAVPYMTSYQMLENEKALFVRG